MNRPAHRRGLTLVELLVAIAIIGILVAITVPSVQAVRESSRKTTCRNNLRQLGIALEGETATLGHYPHDCYRSSYSFLVGLLPYLDQKPLFNSLNFSFDAYPDNLPDAWPNGTAANGRLQVLLCPSDRGLAATGAGWTNYAGNRSVGVQKYGYNGAIVPDYVPGGTFFLDGSSQTIAMSEWTLGPEDEMSSDRRRTVFETPYALTGRDELDKFADFCRTLDTTKAIPSIAIKGRPWIAGDFGLCLYNHTLTPNSLSCLNQTGVQAGAWTAGSFHSGGSHSLFADGHVVFVKDSINLDVWRAIGSRNGKEVVPGDSY